MESMDTLKTMLEGVLGALFCRSAGSKAFQMSAEMMFARVRVVRYVVKQLRYRTINTNERADFEDYSSRKLGKMHCATEPTFSQ
jgi:hypothetical protein